MPLTFSESLDDVSVFAASTDFRGGMNSTVLPHLLPDNQYAEAKNMELTKSGRLQTRGGTEVEGSMTSASPIRNLVWYDLIGSELVLAAQDNELKKWDGSTFSTIAGYTLTGQVSAFQFFNKAIFVGQSAIFESDGTTVAAVTTAGTTAGNIACAHANRVVRAGDTANPEALYVSNVGAGGHATWSSAGPPIMAAIDVGAEGELITGLKSWDVNNLLVFKSHSTYLVRTGDVLGTVATADWHVQPISSNVGCAAHKTAVQVGADVWWLSKQGVVSVRRLQQETQREITDSLSSPIQSYIDRINWSYVSTSTATYHDNKYILSVPLGSATEPDHLLVYDTYHQAWSAYWTGLPSSDLLVGYFNEVPTLYLGGTTGDLLKMDPDLTEDDSSDLSSFAYLKAYNFNEPVSPKALLNIELEFQDSVATVDLNLRLDGSTNDVLELDDAATGNALLTFPWTFPVTFVEPGLYRKAISLLHHRRVRQVQPRLSATADRLSVRSVILSGFVETMLLETP